MPGFVAIVAHEPSAHLENDDVAGLVNAYQHVRGAGDVQMRGVGDWARVASIDGATPIASETDGRSWALAVGSVHGGGRLSSMPLRDLDGQFAMVRHPDDGDRLEVITDPFGMQDVYVSRRGDRTYVSTSALALARHLGAEPDLLGLKLFLRAGVQFGPVTHWRGIERVEPATALRFRAGATPVGEVYWSPTVDEQVRAMTLRRTVDRCVEVGVGLLDRRLGPEPLISADITGGFDSRMVAALLQSAQVNFETMTVAEEPVDARFAREVAETAGWSFRAQELPPDWRIAQEQLDHALGWGDGRLEVLSLAEVLWRQQDRSGISRSVVTGGGGENFGPSPWMQELWRAGRTRSVNYDNLMNMRVFLPLDVSMLRSDPRSEAEPYVREILAQKALPYRRELNTSQLDVIHAYREVGHFGAYRSAGEAEVRAQLPCYFKDFWTVAFSANHRWRNGHRLHRGIIERLHPAVAAVGTQRGGPAELMTPRNVHRFLPYHARLARTAVRKLRRRPGASAGPRPGAAESLRDTVGTLRAEGVLTYASMRSASLYEPSGLEQLIQSAERGQLASPAMLGRVITVELALRSAGASL